MIRFPLRGHALSSGTETIPSFLTLSSKSSTAIRTRSDSVMFTFSDISLRAIFCVGLSLRDVGLIFSDAAFGFFDAVAETFRADDRVVLLMCSVIYLLVVFDVSMVVYQSPVVVSWC